MSTGTPVELDRSRGRTAPSVLEGDALGVGFGGTTVLSAATIVLRSGRVTALVGRNGCGKSTLFRLLSGRLRAEYGRVLFEGSWVPSPSHAHMAARGLFHSSQEADHLPWLRLDRHLDLMARRFGTVDRVPEAIAMMRLEPWLQHRAKALSGGERQRAAMAMAMIRRPMCLLADEPLAGVAPVDRPTIAGAIRDLASEGCAIAVSGHDVEDLFELSDHVVWLTSGTTHDLGTPEDALKNHAFRRGYLGPTRA